MRRLFPAWLVRARRERPDITVELAELSNPDLSLLRQGELDLLVDYFTDLSPDLDYVRLASVRPFLVVPAKHPALRGGVMTASQAR